MTAPLRLMCYLLIIYRTIQQLSLWGRVSARPTSRATAAVCGLSAPKVAPSTHTRLAVADLLEATDPTPPVARAYGVGAGTHKKYLRLRHSFLNLLRIFLTMYFY